MTRSPRVTSSGVIQRLGFAQPSAAKLRDEKAVKTAMPKGPIRVRLDSATYGDANKHPYSKVSLFDPATHTATVEVSVNMAKEVSLILSKTLKRSLQTTNFWPAARREVARSVNCSTMSYALGGSMVLYIAIN